VNQRSVSYPTPRPLLFHGHGYGFRCTRHVSLQRCHDMTSPSLHGVPRDGSPASAILWDAPTPRRPLDPFEFFTSRYHRFRPWFAPLGRGRPTGGQEVVGSGLPIRIYDGNVGASQVPWKPWWSLSVLFDPGRIRQAEWTKSKLPDTAPACVHDEGSRRLVLSGLNHTTFDLAVYASQDGSPHHHARLASGCWSSFARRDSYPQGFSERFQSSSLFLLPKAYLTQGHDSNRVIDDLTNDKIGILSHEGIDATDRPYQGACDRQSLPSGVKTRENAPNEANPESTQSSLPLDVKPSAAEPADRKRSQSAAGGVVPHAEERVASGERMVASGQ